MDDQKKNFSGLVGDLLNGYSDIGWANLFFNLDQAKVMDYTDAYAVDYLAWMVRERSVALSSAFNTIFWLLQAQKPDPLPLWMNTFQPLDSPVWLFLLFTLFFCIVFILVVNKVIFSFNFDLFLLISLPLGEERRWPNDLRIFFIVYTWTMMVVITAYKGGLLSCLAIPVIPSPIGKIT